jgi:competence protein ComEA
MRRSQPDPEHAEAVSRRLATLSAELAAVRHEQPTHTRIRSEASVGPVVSPGVVHADPVIIPAPGRHASRRGAPTAPTGMGERFGLPGIRAIGPAHVAVVAVVAAVAVGLAAWWVLRGAAEPVALPAVATVAPEQDPGGPPEPTGQAASAQAVTAGVTVDVAGDVRRPGIAVLPPGSRVVDALEEAGGARRGVDLTSLNLARVLVDGEQILVGVTAPSGVAGIVGVPGAPPVSGPLVNLNSADQATLEGLPGVGPVTATSIITWRTEHGGFSSVEELLEVDGIGDATLADLAPLVTI